MCAQPGKNERTLLVLLQKRENGVKYFHFSESNEQFPNQLKKKSFMCTVAATPHGTDIMLMMT